MEQNNEIRCPKCNSTQLTANKKGFSGTKAVVGGLLTGGVGLLAGTIGSNKVIITCLACGKEFKPGEGKTAVSEQVEQKETTTTKMAELKKELDERKRIFSSGENIDDALHKILREGFVRGAVNHYKTTMKVSQETAEEYVEKFIVDNNLTDKVKRKGCFVATACYGDYNSPEVKILRHYRDSNLLKSYYGKVFVQTYYILSPPVAYLISKSEFLKKNIRLYILQPIIQKINK